MLSNTELISAFMHEKWHAFVDGNAVSVKDLTLGVNSIDLSLAPTLREILPGQRCIDLHDNESFDWRDHNCTDGYILEPGKLYLGHSRECFDCNAPLVFDGRERYFVQCIEGRSSAARVGLFTHTSAGFGDYGFNREWVFELQVTYPTRVWAGDRLAQAYFCELLGEPWNAYSGAYQKQGGPTVAKLGKSRFQRGPK